MIAALEHSHSAAGIRKRLKKGAPHSYLRDFIYGAVDGAVTTFAIVAGVAGAGLAPAIIIILGLANLLGDGFSMAASNFLGTRAEQDLVAKVRSMEEKHIDYVPEGEREEIRQIFAAKGFEGKQLQDAVAVITADREQWIQMMLREEFGLSLGKISPWIAGIVTFFAFIAVGSLPLLVFVFEIFSGKSSYDPFAVSAILTGAAFFIVGAFKSRFTGEKWYKAGLGTLWVGSIAAALAFGAGALLRQVISM